MMFPYGIYKTGRCANKRIRRLERYLKRKFVRVQRAKLKHQVQENYNQ